MHFRPSSVLALTLVSLPSAGAVEIEPGLSQAIHQALYRLDSSGPGTYRAVNPAQRLSAEFTARGARVQHPEGSVALRLLGYGYGEHLRTPAQVRPIASHDRMEYRRADLIEWYKNEASGLEQGFTLLKRPGNPGEADPLVIAIGVDSELNPELTPQGDAVGLGRVMRYAGLQSWDARGRAAPSRLEVSEQEIRIVVDDRDAEYPLVVDPTWVQQRKLTEPAGASNDEFGYSVSVEGDTAVIGAPGATIGSNQNQGAVFVFVRGGSPPVWTLQQELTALDGAAGDGFGSSVAVSGNTTAIGAPGWNSNQGAAYVFVRMGTTWTQQRELTASDGVAGDQFGVSVAVSGNTAVIGAYAKNNFRGAAYVFVRAGAAWTQQQELTAADLAEVGRFGASVSVSGNMAVIGAPYTAIGSQGISGSAYVFVQTGATWMLQQELTAADEAGAQFGTSVSAGWNMVVIGAPYTRIGSLGAVGTAYVFVWTGTTWTQQQELTASTTGGNVPYSFGASVSVSGNVAVIGAPATQILSGVSSGAAFVFVQTGTTWTQQQELTASDETLGDKFGFSVSVSGGTAVTGAPHKMVNSNASQGAAYVFVSQGVFAPAVSPNAGAGLSQTFTATYTDSNGASDLQAVYLDIGSSGGASSCFAVYVQSTNSLYLFNDTNSAILGPITPGSNSTVSNSKCTLSGAGGTAMSAGTTLTVPFSITFSAGFTGAKNIYGLAQSYGGSSSNWQLLGNWTVATPPRPAAVSVMPNSGSGLTQTFTATYTDPAGASDIQVVYLQIGLAGGGAYSCFAAYIPSANALYLYDDPNTVILGPITPGSSATVSNSRCTLSGNGGVVTASGNNLTVPFSLTFAPTYNGQKNILGYAQNYSGASIGFQMLGNWTAAAGGTLTAVSVSPVNNSGFGPQTFSALYSDTMGSGDIQATYLDFGPSIYAAHSCIVVYVTGNNTLYLLNDNNSGAFGPITAGTNNTVSNSQCTLSGIGGLAAPSGNNLTVPFNLTFTPAFAAQQMVFGLAQSFGGTQSDWGNLGTWTP